MARVGPQRHKKKILICFVMFSNSTTMISLRSVKFCNENTLCFERREENQLDATDWFIALIICSTCFGHLYAHHQELEIILVLLE